MKMEPLVSIVIPNLNGAEYLKPCLTSILRCEYSNYEIIVVDGASNDGSSELLKNFSSEHTEIKVFENPKDLGPCTHRNQGIAAAKGKYVAFLDNDTRVHPLWLRKAVKVFESQAQVGACQCKLLLEGQDNSIDCVGAYLGEYGFLVHVPDDSGIEKDVGQYDSMSEILAAKGAGMIFRKDVLDKIGGFDDDFFVALEETDLCWRVWLSNYRVILIPSSIVYHKFGGTARVVGRERATFREKFYGARNYIYTLIKNLETGNLVKIIPMHIFMWVTMAMYFLLTKRRKSAKWILQGIAWDVFNLGRIMVKRGQVQQLRRVRDREILPKIFRRRGLSYYISRFTDTRGAGYAESWQKDI